MKTCSHASSGLKAKTLSTPCTEVPSTKPMAIYRVMTYSKHKSQSSEHWTNVSKISTRHCLAWPEKRTTHWSKPMTPANSTTQKMKWDGSLLISAKRTRLKIDATMILSVACLLVPSRTHLERDCSGKLQNEDIAPKSWNQDGLLCCTSTFVQRSWYTTFVSTSLLWPKSVRKKSLKRPKTSFFLQFFIFCKKNVLHPKIIIT